MSYRIGETRRINCSVSYFWINFICCCDKEAEVCTVFGPILLQTTYIAGTIGTVPSFGPLCLSTGRWIAASILKTQRYCLRHYIDATMPLALVGNEQQYCSISNFQLVFRGLFFTVCRALPKNADWLIAPIGNAHYKGGKKHRSYCSVLPIRQVIAYWFCFTGAETEIRKIKDDSKIKRQTNLDRHSLRPIPNVCHLPDPPWFSVQTTFNDYYCTCCVFYCSVLHQL